MKIIKFLSLVFVLLFICLLFLINGFETSSLNKIIKAQVESKIPNSQINFDNTRISLGVDSFSVVVKLNNPEFLYKKNKINIRDIKVDIDLFSALQKKYKVKSAYLELDRTKMIAIASLAKELDAGSYAVIANKFLEGSLEGHANINFENLKDISFDGILKNTTIQIYENFPYATEVGAELKYKNSVLEVLIDRGKLADLDIRQSNITLDHKNPEELSVSTKIFIKGKIDYLTKLKEFKILTENIFPAGVENLKGDLNIDILLSAALDKEFSIKNIKSNSKIRTINGSFDYSFAKDKIKKDRVLITQFNSSSDLLDKNLTTKGSFLLNDKPVNFSFSKKVDSKNFQSSFSGSLNTSDVEPFFKTKLIKGLVDFKFNISNQQGYNVFDASLNLDKAVVELQNINYKKEENNKANLDFVFDNKSKQVTNVSKLNYVSKDSKINFSNLVLNQDYKIENFKQINIKTPKNSLTISKNKNLVSVNGSSLDLTEFVKSLTDRNDHEENISAKFNSNVKLNIKKVYIGEDTLNELVSSSTIRNGDYEFLNAFGSFSNNETASIQISRNKKNNLETSLSSDRSRPFLSGLGFAKGFSNGKLSFISEKMDKNTSHAKITLTNFYIKEMPILANLLSLTSFTGIVDTLTGKGVFFDKSYLEYEIKDKILTIKDAYGTGDSLGYTLEGKINPDGFVSIDGNLVPAYLVNDIIRKIPILGKVITGKQGDGVFGASFKIKGQPDALKTTVNPIRTLTPRFIQRFFDLFREGSK